MKVAVKIALGIALVLGTAPNARAAPEDYLKELMSKEIDLLKLTSQLNTVIQSGITDGSAAANPLYGQCVDNDARVIGQLSLTVQNVANLLIVTKIVNNPEEKRQIYTLLQSALTAARGFSQQATQIVQFVASQPSCQNANLNALARNAVAITSDVEGTLAKIAE